MRTKAEPKALALIAPPVSSQRLASTHPILPAMTSQTPTDQSGERKATKAMKAAIGNRPI
jgi:hypothetical protein